jgi:hypothetical protein
MHGMGHIHCQLGKVPQGVSVLVCAAAVCRRSCALQQVLVQQSFEGVSFEGVSRLLQQLIWEANVCGG